MPLELYEARNAIQIARASGADRFATETFQKAEKSLKQAEAYRARNAGSKPVTMTARQAVQIAEDARAIAVKRQDDELLAAERQQSVDREARAESGRAAAQSETDRVSREAEAARIQAQADAERMTREKDAQAAAALAEADRVKARERRPHGGRRSRRGSPEGGKRSTRNGCQDRSGPSETGKRFADRCAGAEADRLKRENDAQRAAAQAELDRAASEKAQLETEKAELRAQLLQQFNAILQTRDTARGLIVNMSDVLFDTAKFTLRPQAREKLAKVAGIVSGHPGLRLDVEGHTDSVGGDDYNQKLSEQRGASVRDYLTQQGMPAGSVTTKGFGKTQPVASNDTAPGRQQNRRVELVISGEVIGTEIGKIIAAK